MRSPVPTNLSLRRTAPTVRELRAACEQCHADDRREATLREELTNAIAAIKALQAAGRLTPEQAASLRQITAPIAPELLDPQGERAHRILLAAAARLEARLQHDNGPRLLRGALALALLLVTLLLRVTGADAADVHTAVIGGQPGSIPQLAQVDYSNAQGDWLCTGSLIAPNIILTAAHCATGTPSSYRVSLPSATDQRVAAVAADPGYDPTANYVNDAALLILRQPVMNVAPLQLAASEPAAGDSATFYGWGMTDLNGTFPTQPMMAQTVIQSDAYGHGIYGPSAATDLFALDYPANDSVVAGGDSGGPLVDSNGVQIGINDLSADDPALPSIFTRVDMIRSWALGVTAANPPRYPIARYRVPRLRGHTLAQARRLLARAHLTPGLVHRAGRPGSITRQAPAAGTWQQAGTRVTTWAGLGRPTR